MFWRAYAVPSQIKFCSQFACLCHTVLVFYIPLQFCYSFIRDISRGNFTESAEHFISRLTSNKEGADSVYLGATNSLVDIHNSKMLMKHEGELKCYKAIDEPGADIRVLKAMSACKANLFLKLTAPVIVTKNGPTVSNGERGIVHQLGDDFVIVRVLSGQTVKLEKVAFSSKRGRAYHTRHQIPLKLAWGLTIHRCQGQTLPAVTVDLRKIYSYTMLGVALSRCRSEDDIHICNLDIDALRNLEPLSPGHLQFIDTGDPPIAVRTAIHLR